ncbi:hypothetical protein PAERUG_P6_East_of_England_6_IMP_1_03_09_03722 [Pseudomonas aeruginosa]|nr:hypothetical protein PAERUG_P6_East_of_England_6_IMP_1_03_09_03722 [Pseudomonas aeruginosa]
MQRNRATLNVEPWLSSGSMAKPEAIAARLPSSSTGLRPKRSLSQADSGVAAAMKSTARHSRPRNSSRLKPRLATP